VEYDEAFSVLVASLAASEDRLEASQTKLQQLLKDRISIQDAAAQATNAIEREMALHVSSSNKMHQTEVMCRNRIGELLTLLKEFVIVLLKSYLEVGRVARRFADEGILDPLDSGDMRTVYCNLHREYKQPTLVHNVSSLMAITRRARGSREPLRQWARTFEEALPHALLQRSRYYTTVFV
jgi:hypothetical protein